jgi:hypothetical protein
VETECSEFGKTFSRSLEGENNSAPAPLEPTKPFETTQRKESIEIQTQSLPLQKGLIASTLSQPVLESSRGAKEGRQGNSKSKSPIPQGSSKYDHRTSF